MHACVCACSFRIVAAERLSRKEREQVCWQTDVNDERVAEAIGVVPAEGSTRNSYVGKGLEMFDVTIFENDREGVNSRSTLTNNFVEFGFSRVHRILVPEHCDGVREETGEGGKGRATVRSIHFAAIGGTERTGLGHEVNDGFSAHLVQTKKKKKTPSSACERNLAPS